MPARNPDLHGDLPESSSVVLLLIDVINDNFGRWQSDFHRVVEHCLHDGVGEAVARLLEPQDDDYFVLKPRHSAFYATTLDTEKVLKADTRPSAKLDFDAAKGAAKCVGQ